MGKLSNKPSDVNQTASYPLTVTAVTQHLVLSAITVTKELVLFAIKVTQDR